MYILLSSSIVFGAFTFVVDSNESIKYTEENSDLPSNNVHVIFIDSNNVKWIGTDKGLSRFDGNWINYSESGFFKSNVINDIAYEQGSFGNELWIATDSGLTVGAFGVDGITGATTYFPGDEVGSTIMDWKVNHVVVDGFNNRWATTQSSITVFKGNIWDKQQTAADANGEEFAIADVEITDMIAQDAAQLVLIATQGKGILRNRFNEVDGISGASTYGQPWAAVNTDVFYAIAVTELEQWYGSELGAYMHPELETKSEWDLYNSEDGLIDNKVISLYIDSDDNIWMGTEKGLSIYLANNKWFKHTENEGLVNNTVNHITSDMEGNVWVSTNGGIEKFTDIPGIEFNPNSIFMKELSNKFLNVYPNPAVDIVNISVDNTKNKNIVIELYNMAGVKVLRETHNLKYKGQPLAIAIRQNNIISGTYILHVSGESFKSSTKLLIRK
ncbi:MAG: T9SS type A sorting domain-containing protein [Salinivirgaceae bacterium]|nr:T9SS type A sorting domain-containing protein [Salinivirgaceae bacterium]